MSTNSATTEEHDKAAVAGAVVERPLAIAPPAARTRPWMDAMGFAALGLVVGMSLGLSAAPVLGTTFTAGFALVGTLIPLYLPGKTAVEDRSQVPPAVGDWLLPFSVCLGLGILVGITIRANDALNFQSANLREKYRKEGFSEKQIDSILDGLAGEIAQGKTPEKDQGVTHLQAKKIPANIGQSLDLVRNLIVAGSPATPEQKFNQLKRLVPADFLPTIREWQENGFDAECILKALGRHAQRKGE